ncbi:MAG: DUF5995 family protein [Acidimicrobiia bacterium]
MNSSPQTIEELIAKMEAMEADLIARNDARRYFHSTYLRTTRAVHDEITRGGFTDGPWVEKWDVVFADLYLQALEQYDATGTTVGPWQVAFDRAKEGTVNPLRLTLLGMNAHINYDLAQALVAVISPTEFDTPAVVAKRSADHAHIDVVLHGRVKAEDEELKKIEPPNSRTWLDRRSEPLNELATKRFLKEARRKVWHNARLLDQARRRGDDAYVMRLSQLEELSRRRILDLGVPGQILMRLAVKGFGVELPA